jgi:hypothetical protein
MKTAIVRMLVFSLLVATLISCETLSTDISESPIVTDDENTHVEQSQNPEAKFLGTWIYSDKNFSETAKKMGAEDWPADVSVEYSFSFRSDATGTFTEKYFTNDIVHEEQQEFLWSLDSISPQWILVVMRENTAINFNLLYESALFLSMNDMDLGMIYFAKQQKSVTE